jgi:ribonuclease J
VLLCEDGDVIQLDAKGISRDGKVPGGYVYVDGTVGDLEHGVLRDRKKLSEEGVVMAVVTVDRQHNSLSCPPVIETRGWVYAPEAEELLEEASEVVSAAVKQALRDGAHDIEVLSRHTRKALGKFVSESTKRRPMIVPVVLMV